MKNDLESAELPFAFASNIEELLQELVDQVNKSAKIDVELVCRSHPQWEEELRSILPALFLFDDSRKLIDAGVPARFDSEHQRRIANYEIGRAIGRGGMGVVYEATQSPLGRRVAIKLLKDVEATPLARQRFEQEFQIAASLHHTNIVPVFDAGEDNGQLYFAMQFIDGIPVSQWPTSDPDRTREATAKALADSTAPTNLYTSGDLPTEHDSLEKTQDSTRKHAKFFHSAASLGNQVAAALEFAHSRGILHRDIKPSNILIDLHENAWITDFGLAKLVDGENLTASGDIAGTIRYLAPERLKGKCDGRSDVYALGLVLLELVTRRPAWDGANGAVLVRKLTAGETCPFPVRVDVPNDFRLIIQKAIQPQPEMRYQTALEMAEDLTRFMEGRTISARRFSRLRSTVLWAQRNPLVASLWSTTILSLVIGTTIATVLAINWQTAATKATQREQETAKERDRVTESLALTRNSVEQMTSAIADRYYSRQTPLSEFERQNLNQIVDYYERLDSLESIDTPIPATKARGLQIVSGIRYKLGQIGQAKQDMLDSVDLFRSLLVEFPHAVDYRAALADGLLQLGIYESENHERGNGLESFLAARKEYLAMPKAPEYQLRTDDGLQAVLANIGTTYFLEKRWTEAREYLEQAVALQRTLVERDPDNHRHRHELAKSISNLVLCLVETKQLPEAEAAATESTTLHLKIVEQDNSPENRFATSVSWIVRGKVDLLGEDMIEAIKSFEEAERIANLLATEFPSVPKYRYHWSSTLFELASCFSDSGRNKESIESHTKEVEIRRQIVNDVPDHLNYRGGLAESLDYLASKLADVQPEKAVESWKESVKHFDEVIRTNPELTWAHEERNNVKVRMAFCYKNELLDLDAALDLFIQAEATWQSLADQSGKDTPFRLWQSGTGQNVGLILIDQGNELEGLARLHKALTVAESIEPGHNSHSTALKTIASIKAAIKQADTR